MAHRLPQHIVTALQAARQAASLISANFDGMGKAQTIALFTEETAELKHTGLSPTDWIRERVKLHHDSWIIDPIDRVLSWSASAEPEYEFNESTDVLKRLLSPMPHPDVVHDAAVEIQRLRDENAELRSFRHAIISAVEEQKK